MNRKLRYSYFAILACISYSAIQGQISSPINPTRTVDWTNVGIPGGIPNRTAIFRTIDASLYGNGTTDVTNAIQNALDSCPANKVVFLGSGTFRINGNLQVPGNVTLRGAGPQQTILKGYGRESAMINFGSGPNYVPADSIAITGGTNKGSQTLTLSNNRGVAVGSYLVINELNDTSFVTINGYSGACTWCDVYYNGSRALGQIVKVTSVNGNSIGISPALYITYKKALSPLATPLATGAEYAGVEDLQLYAVDSLVYSTNVKMYGTAYCWIRNIESNYTAGDHVDIQQSFGCVVRDSYFHDTFYHIPGSADGDVDLLANTSACLVENNQFWRLHASVMLEWGAAGNVVAYNYAFGNFASNAIWALFSSVDIHGAHPMFNLIEGNRFSGYNADAIWGSSSDQTLFRNWIDGTTKICNPLFGRGTADTANSWWVCQQAEAIQDFSEQSSDNFVGNAVGSPEQLKVTKYNQGPGYVLPMDTMDIAPAYMSYDAVSYGFAFGYDNTSTPLFNNKFAYQTAFLHGNFNYADSLVSWDPANTNHTLPPSLYLNAKPSWYGNILWPTNGPDVVGNANENPAQVCFNKGLMPTCLQTISTGLDNRLKTEQTVKVYPNPAKNKIYFDISSTGINSSNVSIYTIEGKLISLQNLNIQTDKSMDISQLDPGMYFVKVATASFNSTQKIVVSR